MTVPSETFGGAMRVSLAFFAIQSRAARVLSSVPALSWQIVSENPPRAAPFVPPYCDTQFVAALPPSAALVCRLADRPRDARQTAHTYRLVKVSVENRWKSSGKYVGGGKNKHCVVFIWSPRRRTRKVSACVYGPVLQILQSNSMQGHFLVQTGL
jgi:hypothetical protein